MAWIYRIWFQLHTFRIGFEYILFNFTLSGLNSFAFYFDHSPGGLDSLFKDTRTISRKWGRLAYKDLSTISIISWQSLSSKFSPWADHSSDHNKFILRSSSFYKDWHKQKRDLKLNMKMQQFPYCTFVKTCATEKKMYYQVSNIRRALVGN